MITLVLLGIGFLVLLAVAVRAVDAARAPMWRAVADERRLNWERSRA
jgi:Tfp pilus assembly protein PilV